MYGLKSNYIFIEERCLVHSAKGSTWVDHKYIKRLNGTYYYPDNYEGGRHLPNGDSKDVDESEGTVNLTTNDIESLAMEVIRGEYGNGQTRKDLLGSYYQQVQDRVNQLMKGGNSSSSIGSINMSEVSEKTVLDGKSAIDKMLDKLPSVDAATYRRLNK